FGDVDEIAGGGEFAATREAIPVDLRDNRGRHVPNLEPSIDKVPRPDAFAGGDVTGQRFARRLREIVAGTEALAVALDNDGADLGVEIGFAQRVEEFSAKRIGKRVALVRTIQGDASNFRLGRIDFDKAIFRHGASLQWVSESAGRLADRPGG